MINLSASARFGYGGRQYVARIKGRDSKFTFNREFIGRKEGKHQSETKAQVDEPGLYEERDIDSKGRINDSFPLILPVDDTDDGLGMVRVPKEDAMKIAKLLDSNKKITEIVELFGQPGEGRKWRYIKPREAVARAEAQTIDTATEACWAALQALPQKQAKAVLKALKLRVEPPKPAAELRLGDDTPTGVVTDANLDAGVSAERLGLTETPIVDV